MNTKPQVKFTVTETINLPFWFINAFIDDVGECDRIEQIKYIRDTFPEKQISMMKAREIAIQIEEMIK